MVLPRFEYIPAKSLEEASNLLQELGDGAKIMNGGTDLLPPMNDGVLKPTHLVDIKGIPGMDYIEYDEKEGLKIGALTNLRDIEFSKVVREKNPSIAAAAAYVASMQVRAKGTIAGNLVNASPSCDTAPILLAQNAKVLVHRHDGKKTEIPMDQFYVGFKKVALERGDIVTGIVIPPLAANEKAAYIKHSVRRAMDLAIVGVAAWIKMDGKKCADVRIALGAVAITPIRSKPAEDLLRGKELTDELLAEAGIAAMNSCKPISDVRASAEYRADMIRVFTKRVINKALEGDVA
jgi:carbon-monoxide dehydrogenase medium subunit